MKRLIVYSLVTACAALNSFGTGSIYFANYGTGYRAPVYGEELWENYWPSTDWGYCRYGNSPSGLPPGNIEYQGELLAGSNYMVAFYAAPGIITDGHDLELGGTSTFRTGSNAGLYYGGSGSFNSIPDGYTGPVTCQVRAWNTGGGMYGSWESAYDAQFWFIPPGATKLVTIDFASGAAAERPYFESFNLGWVDNNLEPIPEPGVVSLLGWLMGLAVVARRWDWAKSKSLCS